MSESTTAHETTVMTSAGIGPQATAQPSNHAQLSSLIKSGVVTHLIPVQDQIDPCFAVSKLQDLSDLHFVAAFEDGLIAFGCIGPVPDVLKNISVTAEPVQPPAPELLVELDKIQTGQDRIEQLLSNLQPLAMVEQRAETEKVFAKIDSLDRRITQTLSNSPDIQHALEKLATRVEAKLPELEPLHDHLEQVSFGIAEISGEDGLLPELLTEVTPIGDLNNRMAQVENRLEKIQDNLSTLGQDLKKFQDLPWPLFDLANQRKAFHQFATVLTLVTKRMETAANAISKQPTSPQIKLVQNSIAELLARPAVNPGDLAKIETALQPDLDHLRDIQHQIASSLDRLPSEIEQLLQKPDHKPDAQAQIFEGLESLHHQFEALAKLTKAKFDDLDQKFEERRQPTPLASQAALNGAKITQSAVPAPVTVGKLRSEIAEQVGIRMNDDTATLA